MRYGRTFELTQEAIHNSLFPLEKMVEISAATGAIDIGRMIVEKNPFKEQDRMENGGRRWSTEVMVYDVDNWRYFCHRLEELLPYNVYIKLLTDLDKEKEINNQGKPVDS